MARILSGPPISGTMGGVTYYMMNGVNYARKKSSLSSKRVRTSKEFEKTRKCASDLGLASKIGSVIYKALPTDIRKDRWLYRAITGEAASLLYKGKEAQEVKELLWKKYIKDTGAIPETENNIKQGDYNHHFTTRISFLKLREVFANRWQKQGLSDYWLKRAWSKRSEFYAPNFRDALKHAWYDRDVNPW